MSSYVKKSKDVLKAVFKALLNDKIKSALSGIRQNTLF